MSHFMRNKWLSYSSPQMLSQGKLTMLLFGMFDKGVRKAAWCFFKNLALRPLNLFRKVNLQTFAIIQAIDFLSDGSMNMCDGCPDITVYKGKLYWSCRLEEIKDHGAFITASAKSTADMMVNTLEDQQIVDRA